MRVIPSSLQASITTSSAAEPDGAAMNCTPLCTDREQCKDQRVGTQNHPQKELAVPVLHPHPTEEKLPSPKLLLKGAEVLSFMNPEMTMWEQ